MHDEGVEGVRGRHELLRTVMGERMTRLWAAAEATVIGHRGVASVTSATGIRSKRIREGMRDLASPDPAALQMVGKPRRIRRPGGGRKPLTALDPTPLCDLESLLEPTARGELQAPLQWTVKSKSKLATELRAMGHKVSVTKVGQLLHQLGYTLRETREGGPDAARDASFERVNAQAMSFFLRRQPVVSMAVHRRRSAAAVAGDEGRRSHPEPRGPAGPLLLAQEDGAPRDDRGGACVDPCAIRFAVETLHFWWGQQGRASYPTSTELLIATSSVDGAGSQTWEIELHRFTTGTGVTVTVCHLPPGTSRWRRCEHQVSAQIALRRREASPVCYEVGLKLIQPPEEA